MGRANRQGSGGALMRESVRDGVLRLWNGTDLSIEEIALSLGCDLDKAQKELRQLRQEGDEIQGSGWNRRAIAERREKVLVSWNSGNTSPSSVAKDLGLSREAAASDIAALRRAGREMRAKADYRADTPSNRARRERVLRQWQEGKQRIDIAQAEGVPIGVIVIDVDVLRKSGIDPSRDKLESVRRRRKEVKRLWNEERLNEEEIARQLQISKQRVQSDLSVMRNRQGLDILPRPEDEETKKSNARREKVLRLNQAGMRNCDIAAKLGLTNARVGADIAALRKSGRDLRQNKPEIEERRSQLKKLWHETDLTVSEIAKRIGAPRTTIVSDIHEMRARGDYLRARKRGRRPSPEIQKRRERVLELRKRGKTMPEIAKALGLSLYIVQGDCQAISS